MSPLATSYKSSFTEMMVIMIWIDWKTRPVIISKRYLASLIKPENDVNLFYNSNYYLLAYLIILWWFDSQKKKKMKWKISYAYWEKKCSRCSLDYFAFQNKRLTSRFHLHHQGPWMCNFMIKWEHAYAHVLLSICLYHTISNPLNCEARKPNCDRMPFLGQLIETEA